MGEEGKVEELDEIRGRDRGKRVVVMEETTSQHRLAGTQRERERGGERGRSTRGTKRETIGLESYTTDESEGGENVEHVIPHYPSLPQHDG